jgi:hypothetical protein
VLVWHVMHPALWESACAGDCIVNCAGSAASSDGASLRIAYPNINTNAEPAMSSVRMANGMTV